MERHCFNASRIEFSNGLVRPERKPGDNEARHQKSRGRLRPGLVFLDKDAVFPDRKLARL